MGHCQSKLSPKVKQVLESPAMSWRLIQGVTRPSTYDRLAPAVILEQAGTENGQMDEVIKNKKIK